MNLRTLRNRLAVLAATALVLAPAGPATAAVPGDWCHTRVCEDNQIRNLVCQCEVWGWECYGWAGESCFRRCEDCDDVCRDGPTEDCLDCQNGGYCPDYFDECGGTWWPSEQCTSEE